MPRITTRSTPQERGMAQLAVLVPIAVHHELRILAAQQGRRVGDIVSELVTTWVARGGKVQP